MKSALKTIARGLFIVLLFPCAALAGFGHFKPLYTLFAQACALLPGIIGNYARAAYYWMTLRHSSLETSIGFGTLFAHPEATLSRRVSIGAYCVLGRVNIGEGAQIASHVQFLSGSRQHNRGENQRLSEGNFTEISIGAECWIGASAIIMSDVGPGATVGAGTVVVRPVPPKATVVGNPARIISDT